MTREFLLAALCAGVLGGCATGYRYSEGGYYYGTPSITDDHRHIPGDGGYGPYRTVPAYPPYRVSPYGYPYGDRWYRRSSAHHPYRRYRHWYGGRQPRPADDRGPDHDGLHSRARGGARTPWRDFARPAAGRPSGMTGHGGHMPPSAVRVGPSLAPIQGSISRPGSQNSRIGGRPGVGRPTPLGRSPRIDEVER